MHERAGTLRKGDRVLRASFLPVEKRKQLHVAARGQMPLQAPSPPFTLVTTEPFHAASLSPALSPGPDPYVAPEKKMTESICTKSWLHACQRAQCAMALLGLILQLTQGRVQPSKP